MKVSVAWVKQHGVGKATHSTRRYEKEVFWLGSALAQVETKRAQVMSEGGEGEKMSAREGECEGLLLVCYPHKSLVY